MDITYYNSFSKIYDVFSPKWYYHKARKYAIEQLKLNKNDTILNLPIGTGQNLEYFQKYLENSGQIIGVDLSPGMLEKAKLKVKKYNYENTQLLIGDAREVNSEWLNHNVEINGEIDTILCDLGLSGFPDWQDIIDNMINILKPGGIIVIMDWYLPKTTLRGKFIKWIGKGEVNRPLYQYLETKVQTFSVNTSFNRGGVFVATGIKK